jgi:putative chitinase
VNADAVVKAYPRANPTNIRRAWPLVLAALQEFGIDSAAVRTAAAATIDVETGGRFEPISEYASGAAYDTGPLAARLGNTPEADGDGQRYKGRGLIQLTGTANYAAAGRALGMDLLKYPELANEPKTAARIFAWYFRTKGIPAAANAGDWERVRRLVNGGLNGWDRFVSGIRSSVPLEWIKPGVALALLVGAAVLALLLFPELNRAG